MKKLIAIAVVFALVAAGSVFAVDLGGEVIGNVGLLQGDNGDDSKVTGSADLKRIRIQGEGEVGDGKFFGWFRAEGEGAATGVVPGVWGHAGWKPIDQFKMWIGSNGGDGFFAKEGQTGWMFYQRTTDTKVTMGGANVWGWDGYNGYYAAIDPSFAWETNPAYLVTRNAFYGGGIDGANGLYLTISPVGMVNINFELPFFMNTEIGDIFKALVAQVDLNFDFGNIAITYAGDHTDATNGKIFGYFNLASIDRLSLDVGFSFTLPENDWMEPIAAGLGVKFDITDAFGFKIRTALSFAGDDEIFAVLADALPYFAVNDNLKIFASLGLTMMSADYFDNPFLGFHINPYVWIGQEWGPSFWAGFKLYGQKIPGADKAAINWAIPIAIGVSF